MVNFAKSSINGKHTMSKESLEIRNFGPVREIRLPELGRINLFIGESGSGKSTVMKVLAMMRWVFKMVCVRTYFRNSGLRTPFILRTDSILKTNGLWPFLKPDSEIIYRNGEYEIRIQKGGLKFPSKYVDDSDMTLQKVAYISDKRVLIPDLAAGNVTLRHNMFYLDETFLNFQKALDVIPASDMDYLGVRMMVRKTAGGRRVFVSGLPGGEKFENLPLTSASSGMQSSVALHFIIRYFSRYFDIVEAVNSTIIRYLATTDNLSQFKGDINIGQFPHRRISLHLEEPELSLFPTNQWGLMQYLVKECIMGERAEIDLTMATHSPYILTALNIMMLAYRARLRDTSLADAIVGHDFPALDPDSVKVWRMTNGYLETIFDDELQLIDGTVLDEVSDTYESLILGLNEIIYG